MSMIQSDLLLGQEGGAGYVVERSLRFSSSDSAYCSRTPASAGNRKTWTWAGWVKRSAIADSQRFFGTLNSGGTLGGHLQFTAAGELRYVDYTSGGTYSVVSSSLYRDPSAWYHIVCAFDTTQATAASRIRLYVNSVLLTSFSTANYHPQNTDGELNTATAHSIGRAGDYAADYFTGYFADIYFIDGQALTPSSFTEVSATTGQLLPRQYTGSFGTNGFWLKFSDNSAATATTLGKDYSGNSNNWTPNNLSVTAGAGNDSLVDTPTSYGTDTGAGGSVRGNYCTWNPLGTAGPTPSNGNLDIASSSTAGNRIGTILLTSGKWYWECVGTGYVGAVTGIGGEGFTGSASTNGSRSIGYWFGGAIYWDGGSYTSGIASYTSSDIIGIAVDMTAGTVAFYKNNSLQYTATFGSGTVPNLSTGVFPSFNTGNPGSTAHSVTANFGQRQWAYAAPSGFRPIVDTLLPAPVVAKPSTAMDVKLYTGNGSTQTISGLGFSPDLVWIKARSSAQTHVLMDTVRGTSSQLFSNLTNAEGAQTDQITAFNSDGFALGANAAGTGGVNTSSVTYAGWTWDAGSSTVTNTQGSITSQVRANASAGFSVSTFTKNANTNETIGHGLGVAPTMVIVKTRESSGYTGWAVYHVSTGSNGYLELNTTSAFITLSTTWNNTAPTSSVFTMGTGWTSTQNMVAYCFSPVSGYSSFGSYTGNGSADGPFVYTGFRPRWVLTKASSSTGLWNIHDTARSNSNPTSKLLWADSSSNEVDYAGGDFTIDCLSNGFKARAATASLNASGVTYIYAAFAESPFQYARAR